MCVLSVNGVYRLLSMFTNAPCIRISLGWSRVPSNIHAYFFRSSHLRYACSSPLPMPMFEFIHLPFTIFIQRMPAACNFLLTRVGIFKRIANDHPAFIHRRAGSITINEHRTHRISCFIHVYAKKASSSRDTDATYATLFCCCFLCKFSLAVSEVERNYARLNRTTLHIFSLLRCTDGISFYLLFCSYVN